jgi:hypothetical protein
MTEMKADERNIICLILVPASIFEFHFEFQIEICGCADLLNLLEYLLIDNVIVYKFNSVFLFSVELVKSNKYKNRIENLLFDFLFYISILLY